LGPAHRKAPERKAEAKKTTRMVFRRQTHPTPKGGSAKRRGQDLPGPRRILHKPTTRDGPRQFMKEGTWAQNPNSRSSRCSRSPQSLRQTIPGAAVRDTIGKGTNWLLPSKKRPVTVVKTSTFSGNSILMARLQLGKNPKGESKPANRWTGERNGKKRSKVGTPVSMRCGRPPARADRDACGARRKAGLTTSRPMAHQRGGRARN